MGGWGILRHIIRIIVGILRHIIGIIVGILRHFIGIIVGDEYHVDNNLELAASQNRLMVFLAALCT